MNLIEHAKRELDIIGLTEEDEYNGMMRKHILHVVKEFADEGHSGFSANYAINLLEKLLRFEPLAPLTGEDSEWNDCSMESGYPHFQNKRCSHVFKDETGSYDIRGKVFWEWYQRDLEPGEVGYPGKAEPKKSYFTSSDSRVYVTFPYVPTTVYEERVPE